MNKLINGILVLITLSSSGCFLFGDEGGTTTGNPQTISVELAAYDNSFVSFIRKLIIDDAAASISNLQFCFKRLRFKATAGDSLEYNYDYTIGQIEILSTGTSLNDVTIQKGTYTRVEFDLEKNCDGTTKPSVYLANGNGNFQTDDRITIKFDGNFTVDQTTLNLLVTNFTNALKTFNQTNNDIKPTLEGLSGSF